MQTAPSAGSATPERLGRYEIVRTIGQGAMGVVYEGLDPVIGRKVAIKTIRRREDLSGAEAAEYHTRLLREAKAVGLLNHPNIVSIYDAGDDEATGAFYMAMEYVLGATLEEALHSGAAFPLAQTAALVTQVATALDYAHKRGVIHRDVKPANIILAEDGSVKLADFGIAHIESLELTRTGQVLGTPRYMAPEQLTGSPVDHRADLYAMGVLLYRLLTGEYPFKADSATALGYQIVHGEAPAPSMRRPDLPAGLDAVIAKALAKSPDSRYQSGAELHLDLTAVIEGRAPALGSPVPTAEQIVVSVPARAETVIALPPSAIAPPSEEVEATHLQAPAEAERSTLTSPLPFVPRAAQPAPESSEPPVLAWPSLVGLAIVSAAILGAWKLANVDRGRVLAIAPRPVAVPAPTNAKPSPPIVVVLSTPPPAPSAPSPSPTPLAPPTPKPVPTPTAPTPSPSPLATKTPPVVETVVTLSFEHDYKEGLIEAYVDGGEKPAVHAALRSPSGKGVTLSGSFKVGQGHHKIAVHVTVPGKDIDASGTIDDDFPKRETYLVVKKSYWKKNKLSLSWK